MAYTVVGDIGGTKTRVAVCNTESCQPIIKEVYESKYVKEFYDCINFILKEAHEKFGIEVDKGCFDIAGPLDRDRNSGKGTNLDWGISKDDILKNTMLNRVILLNDFEAIGFGINIDRDDLLELHHPEEPIPSYGKTAAIIGTGTGLGMSILIYDKLRGIYLPYPSEGGHTDFVPKDELEFKLQQYLIRHVCAGKDPGWERVVSGQGLANIYNFLRYERYEKHNELTHKIDVALEYEKPALITKHAPQSTTCAKTIDMFIDFYARCARDLALTTKATDGIYISGGIVKHLLDHFKKPQFIYSFEKNDRKSKILRNIPVYLITDEDINLKGCCLAMKNESHLR